MSFSQIWAQQRAREDAEKPFWISYADLMTALMVLFLVVMVAALSTITKKAEEVKLESDAIERKTTSNDTRADEIESVCDHLSKQSKQVNSRIVVDCALNRIHFGEYGRFKTGGHTLSAEGQEALIHVIPLVLQTAEIPLGKKWLKQVVVEGYTDTDGSYLYNLHLSLKRSEWVMCTLLRNDHPDMPALNAPQRKQVKKLFLAGGVAFNNSKDSKDESRRVELRLQFYGGANDHQTSPVVEHKFDDNEKDHCMI